MKSFFTTVRLAYPRHHYHGLDRVRFRGIFLRALSYVRGMSGFLFGYRSSLSRISKSTSRNLLLQIRQTTHDLATACGRPLETFRNPDKEAYALFRCPCCQRLAWKPSSAFSATESCLSYGSPWQPRTKKLELHMRPRKCLHYYHYYLHPIFGLMHIRLQTWFPFSIHVCLNGRDWLARQLDEEGIPVPTTRQFAWWKSPTSAARGNNLPTRS